MKNVTEAGVLQQILRPLKTRLAFGQLGADRGRGIEAGIPAPAAHPFGERARDQLPSIEQAHRHIRTTSAAAPGRGGEAQTTLLTCPF
jgi:hypothetical protein